MQYTVHFERARGDRLHRGGLQALANETAQERRGHKGLADFRIGAGDE
jgi:hypothetical protein